MSKYKMVSSLDSKNFIFLKLMLERKLSHENLQQKRGTEGKKDL